MLTQPSSLLSWTFQLFYRSINTNDDDILCILSRRPMVLIHSVSTEAVEGQHSAFTSYSFF